MKLVLRIFFSLRMRIALALPPGRLRLFFNPSGMRGKFDWRILVLESEVIREAARLSQQPRLGTILHYVDRMQNLTKRQQLVRMADDLDRAR